MLGFKTDPDDDSKEQKDSKVTVLQHLVKKEEFKEERTDYAAPAGTVSGPGYVPPAQRPTPTFIQNPKLESTIPWETPAGVMSGGEEGRATASHRPSHDHHHKVLEVAKLMANIPHLHHSHCHGPPAPQVCSAMNTCHAPTGPPTVTTKVTIWCSQDDRGSGAPSTSGGDSATGQERAATDGDDMEYSPCSPQPAPVRERSTRAATKRRYKD